MPLKIVEIGLNLSLFEKIWFWEGPFWIIDHHWVLEGTCLVLSPKVKLKHGEGSLFLFCFLWTSLFSFPSLSFLCCSIYWKLWCFPCLALPSVQWNQSQTHKEPLLVLSDLEKTFAYGAFILYQKAEEDLDHLFWGFQYVRTVWNLFLQEFDVSIVGQRSVHATI